MTDNEPPVFEAWKAREWIWCRIGRRVYFTHSAAFFEPRVSPKNVFRFCEERGNSLRAHPSYEVQVVEQLRRMFEILGG